MKPTHIALVIGGLFILKKWADGRSAQVETMPLDQYSSVTNIWEALNGSNLTATGNNPNRQGAFCETGSCGLGTVGVM